MKFVIIIPARLNSSRLSRKVLMKIGEKSMLQIVYENCLKSDADDVIIACDSEEIVDEIKSFSGKFYVSKKEHKNGTSRIAELAESIQADYIINVQADEPMLSQNAINNLIKVSVSSRSNVATLKSKIDNHDELDDPNVVKVITDNFNNAIYFSRSCIPFNRLQSQFDYFKHIGVYSYKRDFLLKYVEMNQGSLEKIESLEQLRILENGHTIKVVEIRDKLIGVDTIGDLINVREILKNDKL